MSRWPRARLVAVLAALSMAALAVAACDGVYRIEGPNFPPMCWVRDTTAGTQYVVPCPVDTLDVR